MRLLLRKIVVLVIAAGLVSASATSPSHAISMAAEAGTDSAHEAPSVPHYADLAIEPDDQNCPQTAAESPIEHSHDDGLCKKSCAACVMASLMPSAPISIRPLTEARETLSMYRSALVAHAAPIDPAIPKLLN